MHKVIISCWGTLAALLVTAGQPALAASPTNIAEGRPYELNITPNYALSTDGDEQDLTDGKHVSSDRQMWVQDGGVTWQRIAEPVTVTIDLGERKQIDGFSARFGGGTAGVAWPISLAVMVSDDGQSFRYLGDVARMTSDPLPPAWEGATTAAYRTMDFDATGRYVRVAMVMSGRFMSCDEIEVYGQDITEDQGASPTAGQATVDVAAPDRLTALGAYQLVRRHWEAVQGQLSEADGLNDARRDELADMLQEARQALEAMPAQIDAASFNATVPINDAHRQILSIRGGMLEAADHAPLTVWHSDRYAPLDVFTTPKEHDVSLDVRLMDNEHRAEVVNITNASTQGRQVTLRLDGFSAGQSPATWARIYRVDYVGTRQGNAPAAALIELEQETDGYRINVPAGMTRQVWISFHPDGVEPGTRTGSLVMTSEDWTHSAPLRVSVAPIRMADQKALSVGLWDYAFSRARAITDGNYEAAMADMNAHDVNVAWGMPQNLPTPEPDAVDEQGNLVGEIDFSRFDRWIEDWPGARRYIIFAYYQRGSGFAGLERGTEAFANAVRQWAEAWREHNEALGLEPGRAGVLFIDEPFSPEEWAATEDWAKPFKQGGGDALTVFVDPPTHKVIDWPEAREAMQWCDIICPTRASYDRGGEAARAMYQQLREDGKALWFYMCSGPVRQYDPGYYRYQPWHAFREGGTGSNFWAYGDNGKAVSGWNEYTAIGNHGFTPVYIAPDRIAPSKHWKALREGVQDFEYLSMLQQRIEEAEQQGGAERAIVQEARTLLDNLAATTLDQLQAEHGQHYHARWHDESASTLAEDARLNVLRVLTEMRQ